MMTNQSTKKTHHDRDVNVTHENQDSGKNLHLQNYVSRLMNIQEFKNLNRPYNTVNRF